MGGKGVRKITDNGEGKMKKNGSWFLPCRQAGMVHGSWLKSIFVVLCLVSCALCLVSCGYTTRSMISAEFKTIYVVPFMNKIDITQETDVASKYRIYRPMLESDITKYVTNKYLFDGNLKPVKEGAADLILKGEVIEFRRDPLRYNDSDEVTEYRISLVVNINLWNRKEDKLVWEEKGFTGDTTYFALTTNPQYKSEASAITDALDDLARRIVERTVEQW
jgi:hypothetical protein